MGETGWILSRLRGRVGTLVAWVVAIRLLNLVVLAPLTAGVLRLFLERWGRCSVGNFEIAAFLLSPVGLTALVVGGALALATAYIEFAGLAIILAQPRPSLRGAFAKLAYCLPSLLVLGLLQVGVYLLLAIPFLVAIAGIYFALWAGRDLNGLLVVRPPEFWLGAGLAGAVAAVYAVLAAKLFLRWLYTVPTVLFEPGTYAVTAMRRGTERTRGSLPRLALALGLWLILFTVLSALVVGALALGSEVLLDAVGLSLAVVLPVTAAVLIVNVLVLTIVSIVGSVSFVALVLGLYQHAVGPAALEAEATDAPAGPQPRGRVAAFATLALLIASGIGSYVLLRGVKVKEDLEITAHRGGAAVAPENTVAAIRKAIEARADWAEIDVQLTADGALVVTHDTDLLRAGGPRTGIGAATLAEIQKLDVGSLFSPEFKGERIPTLDEVIAAAGDGLRLNIELKPHGAAGVGPLVDAVVEAVRRAGIVDRCRLCSQSYEAMQQAKRREPRLVVGYIAGAALGDLTGLEVDFLMVRGDRATRQFVEQADVRALPVHAWTINDPDVFVRLIDRGVANVITDDPGRMRQRLDEIRALNTAERLLLRARNALAD